MAEYGNGITLKQAFELDRERLIMALNGKLLAGETETGFHYEPAPRKECEDFIKAVFDNACYQALSANNSALILEKMLRKHSKLTDTEIFMEYKDEALKDMPDLLIGEDKEQDEPGKIISIDFAAHKNGKKGK